MPGHHLMLDLRGQQPLSTSTSTGMCPRPDGRTIAATQDWIADCRAATGRNRPHAPDERRAARHVSQRRRRFQRDRGDDEAHGRRAGEDVLRRLCAKRSTANLSYARQVAERIGTEHHEVRGRHGRFFQRPAATDLA